MCSSPGGSLEGELRVLHCPVNHSADFAGQSFTPSLSPGFFKSQSRAPGYSNQELCIKLRHRKPPVKSWHPKDGRSQVTLCLYPCCTRHLSLKPFKSIHQYKKGQPVINAEKYQLMRGKYQRLHLVRPLLDVQSEW